MAFTTEQVEIDINPARGSAVAWGAVIAGALAASAVSLALMLLGSGLGLAVASPWSMEAVGAVAVGSVIWLVVVQWIASALGGYFTGRLRSRSGEPPDETFFRDTSNGFLSWALATLLVAGLLTSAVSALVRTGAEVAGTVAAGAAEGAGTAASAVAPNAPDYFVDLLYRPGSPAAAPVDAATAPTPPAGDTTTLSPATPDAAVAVAPAAPAETAPSDASAPQAAEMDALRAETGRVLLSGLSAETFPAEDVDYLATRVSAATGLSADEARARVNGVVERMQAAKLEAAQAADAARKAASKLALFLVGSLLIGAFIAAAAAALGGGHRDEIPVR